MKNEIINKLNDPTIIFTHSNFSGRIALASMIKQFWAKGGHLKEIRNFLTTEPESLLGTSKVSIYKAVSKTLEDGFLSLECDVDSDIFRIYKYSVDKMYYNYDLTKFFFGMCNGRELLFES